MLSAVEVAAGDGNVDLLTLAIARAPPTATACKRAARGGHISCLKLLHKAGAPWDDQTCTMAARNGHLDCLIYARTNGCPWNERTCEIAALRGNYACLKFCHTNGCPWDEGTVESAILFRHMDCLRFAHENGCPYHPEFLSEIARHVLLPKWKALFRMRCIATYWHDVAGRTSHAPGGAGRQRHLEAYAADFA